MFNFSDFTEELGQGLRQLKSRQDAVDDSPVQLKPNCFRIEVPPRTLSVEANYCYRRILDGENVVSLINTDRAEGMTWEAFSYNELFKDVKTFPSLVKAEEFILSFF